MYYNNFQNRLLDKDSTVLKLILINIIFFVADMLLPQLHISDLLAVYYPASPNYHFYQILTHQFIHAGFAHLFFNMFNLYMFGFRLEQVWGRNRFLLFYLFCGFGAFLLHMGVKAYQIYSLSGSLLPVEASTNQLYYLINVPTVGASGAIYGLLAAYGYYFANSEIYLYGIIPVKVKYFVLGMIAISLYLGFSNNPNDNVAHFAHLGGALFGFILVKLWNKNRNSLY